MSVSRDFRGRLSGESHGRRQTTAAAGLASPRRSEQNAPSGTLGRLHGHLRLTAPLALLSRAKIRLAEENPRWGCVRIRGELQMTGRPSIGPEVGFLR
jgi:hypothetical protein